MKMRRKLKLDELNRLSPAEYQMTEKIPLIFVLDNIRSGLNVGAAFRTADAFAVKKIYLCGITAKPPHREILKTAIGANETVEWEYSESVEAVCESLKGSGAEIIGIEQTSDSESLFGFDFQLDRASVLVFGNEVHGLSDETLPLLDRVIEIPQFGTKHSLNVSVTIGICAAEYRRQFGNS